MDYHTFLLLLSQMSGQRKAKVVLQGSVIFVETGSKNDHWNLSTKISKADTKKLKFELRNGFRWQGKGAYLKVDSEQESVYLVQEVVSSKKYLPFKYLIEDFASIACEWKEIFEEDEGFAPHVG
jgi:hypothetical protein